MGACFNDPYVVGLHHSSGLHWIYMHHIELKERQCRPWALKSSTIMKSAIVVHFVNILDHIDPVIIRCRSDNILSSSFNSRSLDHPVPSSNPRLCLRLLNNRIVLVEVQRHTVNTVTLICRCIVTLALEHMSQMSSTVRADNLRPLHSKRAIRVTSDRSIYGIEVCGPSTA